MCLEGKYNTLPLVHLFPLTLTNTAPTLPNVPPKLSIRTNRPHRPKTRRQKQTQQPLIAVAQANREPPPPHFTPFSHLFSFSITQRRRFSRSDRTTIPISPSIMPTKRLNSARIPLPQRFKNPILCLVLFFLRPSSPNSYLPSQIIQTT